MSTEKIALCKQSLEWHKEALLLAVQSYNKAILSLSTATLGFTFAFVKWLGLGNHSSMLIWVWVSLILSDALILLSFLLDQIHTVHRIDYLYYCVEFMGNNAEEKKKLKAVNPKHWTDDVIFYLQTSSGIFLVMGIVLFTIFAGINI